MTIWIPNLSGIQMVDLCPVVKWSGIQMGVWKPDWEKALYGPKCLVQWGSSTEQFRYSDGLWSRPFETEFQNGRSKLGRFIYNENLFIYIKQLRLAMVRFSNGPYHSKTELSTIKKTFYHSKTELWNVQFSNGFGIRMFSIRAPTVFECSAKSHDFTILYDTVDLL